MWKAIVAVGVVGVVGCGPGLARQETPQVGREAFARAMGDPSKMLTLVRGPVTNGGVVFEEPTCAAQFPQSGEIGADRREAFAHCLAGLAMQPSGREDALGDVVVMKYGAGFEAEARVVQELDGPRLTWIGFVSRRADGDNLPTITAAALESLRMAGDRDGPLDDELGKALVAGAHGQLTFAWLKVCIDASGAVTDARAHEMSTPKAGDALASSAMAWQFHPFRSGSRELPVCALVRMMYPPGSVTSVETIPLPPPPSKQGKRPPYVLAENPRRQEGRRIVGEINIVPDDETKTAIRESRVRQAHGRFRVCVDETGRVESVLPILSTKFASYDRDIMAAMRTWQYSPYMLDGQPVAVCTGVTFIYTQH